MAKMYPEWISPEQRSANPQSRAEFKVYDRLQEALGDEWTVMYSRTWTWLERSGTLRAREVDFVIAHPKYGILLLEVKGGKIEVKDGQWTSTDRNNETWPISPYIQLANATRALERRIQDEKDHRISAQFKDFRFGNAVCFPDVPLDWDKLPDIPFGHRAITVDANLLRSERLDQTLKKIMADAQGRCSPPGEMRIEVIKGLLAYSWYLNSPKSVQIADTETEIRTLTEEQFELLNMLIPQTRRLLVSGCVGTGKTMVAMEAVRGIANLDQKRVLLTCFNRNLARWIESFDSFAGENSVDVKNYHRLCSEFAKEIGVRLPSVDGLAEEERERVFTETYPNALWMAAENNIAKYDAIVVDEGQDFYASWWETLQLLLSDDGQLVVFYDPEQRISGPPKELPSAVLDGMLTIDLNKNLRNTKNIHRVTMMYHPSRGRGFKALCSEGTEPEYLEVRPGEKERAVVTATIRRLVQQEGIPASQIAVLTPLSLSRGESQWKIGMLLGECKLVHQTQFGKNQVFLSSIKSAKGLEFSVAIITELALFNDLPQSEVAALLYVGISRAKNHVVFVGTCDVLERIPGNKFQSSDRLLGQL